MTAPLSPALTRELELIASRSWPHDPSVELVEGGYVEVVEVRSVFHGKRVVGRVTDRGRQRLAQEEALRRNG